FFDLDNTMMVGASMFYFARGLASRRFLTARDIVVFSWRQIRFRASGRESPEHMMQAREAALRFAAGRRVAELALVSEEIYDELMAGRIWNGTRELAQAHLDAGERVWLVTAAPIELARVVAARLGLTGALGTVAESTDGRYTGRLVGVPLHGPSKAAAVRRLAAAEGLDLARCTAYTDSFNDLPMLQLVGTPVAVNPDPRLRAEAERAGWPIHDFRARRRAGQLAVRAVVVSGALAAAGAVTAIAYRVSWGRNR
ncbi:MAG: HAD family hydrolase, partial [Mycobacteriales bacterium]